MRYQLQLYVAGDAELAASAQHNLRALLELNVDTKDYSLEIIDVLTHPQRAIEDRVVVTPMLAVIKPQPEVRILGDLSDEQAVLSALRISARRSDHSRD